MDKSKVSDGRHTPLFSIVMPSFNVEEYITATVQSVLDQTFEHFELIVVDDGSSDRTKEIVSTFTKSDHRVVLVNNERSSGPSGARNTGAAIAKAEWICFLDSDDLLTPDALSLRLEAINKFPACDFFSSDFVFWYPEENEKSQRKSQINHVWAKYFNPQGHEEPFTALDQPLDAFFETVLTWTGVATIRRSLFERLKGFDECLHRGEDDHLWWRAAATSKQVVLIHQVTAYYRQRMTGITRGTGSVSPYAPIMFGKLLRDPLFSGRERSLKQKRALHIYVNCLSYRENGQRIKAISSAFRYWLYYPFQILAIRNLIACLVFRS